MGQALGHVSFISFCGIEFIHLRQGAVRAGAAVVRFDKDALSPYNGKHQSSPVRSSIRCAAGEPTSLLLYKTPVLRSTALAEN